MNEKHEQDIPLNWARRAGRPAKRESAPEPAPPRIPRITRLMALAIKFQDMVDCGEFRDYADIARLGYVTRARLTQIMNLLLLDPGIQEQLLFAGEDGHRSTRESSLRPVASCVHWPDQKSRFRSTRATRPRIAAAVS